MQNTNLLRHRTIITDDVLHIVVFDVPCLSREEQGWNRISPCRRSDLKMVRR